jgi:hypothetical protein
VEGIAHTQAEPAPTPLSAAEPSPVVTTVSAGTFRDISLQERDYLQALGHDTPFTTISSDDDDLRGDLALGHGVCGQRTDDTDEELVDGVDGPPTLDGLIENDGGDEYDKAAIRHLCPKYLSLLRSARGGFADGTYTIGKDIKPGTYRTTRGPVTDCYWERSTPGGDIIANGFVTNAPRGVTVTVRQDEGFTSEGCGNWVRA